MHRSVAARELERAGVRRGGWHGGPVAAAAGGTEGQLPPAPSQAMVQTPSPDATRAFQLHEARVGGRRAQEPWDERYYQMTIITPFLFLG